MTRPADTAALLAHMPLFRGMSRLQLERLAGAVERRPLARGDVLFREGEEPAGLCLVVFGRIALSESAGSRRRIVELVEPGRSFAEAILFLERPSLVTAAAASDSLVLVVPKRAVLEAVGADPAFAQRIIANLAARVERLVRQLRSARSGTGTERFVTWLLRHSAVDAGGGATVTLPAAKKTIAAQLGLSAEHFSRILRELASDGLLEVDGRTLSVPDAAGLQRFLSEHQGFPSSPERASRTRAPSRMSASRRSSSIGVTT